MNKLIVLILSLAACGAAETTALPDAAPSDAAPYACPAPPQSSCGNPASIIQGVISVPPGSSAARQGGLSLTLMHRRYGNPAQGGHPHWQWRFENVDLTQPYPFTIDMCDGDAIMWSEENCEYNLIAILDTNGNNTTSSPATYNVPDEGEAAVMVSFDLSCHAAGPQCLELSLDCLDGASCIAYESPGACECAEPACESQSAICLL